MQKLMLFSVFLFIFEIFLNKEKLKKRSATPKVTCDFDGQYIYKEYESTPNVIIMYKGRLWISLPDTK